jgi:DNA-binding transcriptional LysR family regulator
MNMEQLTYFSAVVEEGTISGAARRLHMSQPPLSLQIRKLEQEYGVLLFERGARQIRLTEAGKLLYDYAQRILDLKDSAEEDLKSLHAGKGGSLKLGIISSGACEELFAGIRAFRQNHAQVRIKLFDGNTFLLLDALERQRIELALVRTPFLSRGLDILHIRSDPFAAAGAERYFRHFPADRPVHLKEIKDLPLIVYRRREKQIRQTMEAEQIQPDYSCINDDARTSIQWAAAGLGVALVPASVLPLAPRLPYRLLAEENLSSDLCLVRRSGQHPSDNAQAFFRAFAELYGS